jgi:hypothetical protein
MIGWLMNNELEMIWKVLSPRSRGSRQCSVWLRAGRSGFDPRLGQRIFLLAPASRPALGPTQPLIQWVPKGVKRGRSVTLTTHPHLVPRLSMSRNYTSSPSLYFHGIYRVQLYFFYYPRICLEELRITMKSFIQDSRYPGPDLNLNPPEYEAGMLTSHTQRSVTRATESIVK